jgi:hypothetical protein
MNESSNGNQKIERNDMSTENKKNEFMLLFRGNEWHDGMSAEDIQKVVGQMMEWFKRLTDQGTAVAGSPLEAKGQIVSMKNGRVVADGPFAESKEAIGGYFLLHVETFEEAVAIAKQCPVLAHGAKVEVRQVAETCPVSAKLQAAEQLAHAHA